MLFHKVLFYFSFIYVAVFLHCVSVCHEHAVPLVPKEGVRSPETRVTNCCEPPYRCWELNLGTLEEQPLLLGCQANSVAPTKLLLPQDLKGWRCDLARGNCQFQGRNVTWEETIESVNAGSCFKRSG